MSGSHRGAGSLSTIPEEIIEQLGGSQAFDFYRALVELDTTNLEDIKTGRVEKRNYREACDLVTAQAERWGFAARVWDPTKDEDKLLPAGGPARPNVIVDHDVGARERLLIIAHYDCVPVPDAQRRLWKYDPFQLTFADGRFYGRGCNDDKGSGVFCTLEAMRELKEEGARQVNVRMIAACDEETGGTGGLSAIVRKDALLRERGQPVVLDGHLAMLPDASPNVIAGSSGVTFSDIIVQEAIPSENLVGLLEHMLAFRTTAMKHKSRLDSGDWPDGGAPDPKITGRFTVTKLEWQSRGERNGLRLKRVHAETESYNAIPEIITVEFDATPEALAAAEKRLKGLGELSKRVEVEETTGEGVVEGRIIIHGKGGHGGYPHRFDNPMDHAPRILEALFSAGPGQMGMASLGFDMRTIPEEEPEVQFRELESHVKTGIRKLAPGAEFKVPDHGMRPGYYVPPEEPRVRLLQQAFEAVSGTAPAIIGEYGGTDASFFTHILTPAGEPMIALLFGSMDNEANIHSWNENAKPELLRQNKDVIKWIAKNWRTRG